MDQFNHYQDDNKTRAAIILRRAFEKERHDDACKDLLLLLEKIK